MNTTSLRELTSREYSQYIRQGGDLVFLPVGSIERRGPHLPLGAHCYIANTLCSLLANRFGGLCAPLIPFSSVDNKFSGVSGHMCLNAKATYDYILDVCHEFSVNGLRRIIIVGYMRELYYIPHEMFQRENVPVLHVNPASIILDEQQEPDAQETWLTAAALKLAGRDDLLEGLLNRNIQFTGKYNDPRDSNKNWYSIGVSGITMSKNQWEVLPISRIDVSAAIMVINKWVDDMATPLSDLEKYCGFLSHRRFDRGIV